MRKVSILIVVAVLASIACSKSKTSEIPIIKTTETANSVNTNSALNSNISNQNGFSQTQAQPNPEILRQIETQQLETADPRKAAKQDHSNNNQPPKKNTTTAGKQTW